MNVKTAKFLYNCVVLLSDRNWLSLLEYCM